MTMVACPLLPELASGVGWAFWPAVGEGEASRPCGMFILPGQHLLDERGQRDCVTPFIFPIRELGLREVKVLAP